MSTAKYTQLHRQLLKEISENAFAALCEMKKGELDLSGLKKLPRMTNEIKISLSKKRKSHSIRLNGIEEINESEAEILSQYNGNFISLDGLKSLGLPVTQKLALYQGCSDANVFPQASISLRGLKCLTDDEAQALAKFRGELILPKELALKVKSAK
jgi:hypothetical protein